MISFVRKTKTERGPFQKSSEFGRRSGGFSPRKKTNNENSYDACWVSMFVFCQVTAEPEAGGFQSRRECREWISLLNFASPRTRVPGREATKTQTKAPWRICGIAIFPRPVGQTHEPVGGFTLSSFGAVLIKGSMVPRFESKRHYLLCERAVRSTIPIRVARCTSVIPSVGPQPMLAFLRSSLLPRT